MFDLKSVLVKSLRGYIEINLSRNEIIGDVLDRNTNGELIAVDVTAPDGTRFTYDGFARWFAENMLLSSPEQFLEKCNCNWLIACFRGGKSTVDVICTVKDSFGNPRELRKTYYLSEQSGGDIYAICAVSDITDAVYSMQYFEIAADLTDSFEGIFYVDINDDTYVALKTKGAFYNIIHNISGRNFFSNSLKHLRSVVHKDDYQSVEAFLQKDFLAEKLKNGNITSMIFRLNVNEKEIFYRARVSRSGDDIHHIVFALENVSEFVLNEKIQNEKLVRDKAIIEVLAAEYSSIYYVDLKNNSFEVYKLNNQSVPDRIRESFSDISFTEAYEKCVTSMVYEPDQSAMLKAGSIYNILSQLKTRDSFSTIYRSGTSGGATFCEMKIARVENNSFPEHVVIGFADDSPEKTREIEKAKNINAVLQLSNDFEAVYEVDVKSGKYTCYSNNDIFGGEKFFSVMLNNNLFKGFAEASDKIVFADDRPMVKAFLTREYLLSALSKNTEYQMDFRLLIDGIPTWHHLKVVMGENSNRQTMIFGIFNIESIRQKESFYLDEMRKLKQRANYDSLTGIRNKNAYILFAADMDKTMQESQDGFAVAVFDVNDLKKVNDQLGHEQGDLLIKKVSGVICEAFQHSPVFRIGGDEFVAILKGRDYENRKELIDSFRQESLENVGTDNPVTACGMSERTQSDTCLSDIFSRADEDMYKQKKYLKSL